MELETPQPPKTFRRAPEKLEMIMNHVQKPNFAKANSIMAKKQY